MPSSANDSENWPCQLPCEGSERPPSPARPRHATQATCSGGVPPDVRGRKGSSCADGEGGRTQSQGDAAGPGARKGEPDRGGRWNTHGTRAVWERVVCPTPDVITGGRWNGGDVRWATVRPTQVLPSVKKTGDQSGSAKRGAGEGPRLPVGGGCPRSWGKGWIPHLHSY